MASDTGTSPFARLPAELKLEILRHHTSFLTTRNGARYARNRKIENCLNALSHRGTENTRAFLPQLADLVTLHYPHESKAITFYYFQLWHEYYGRPLDGDADEYWSSRVVFLASEHQRPAVSSSELLWLRYLALIRFRLEEILLVFDQVWYPSLRAKYTYTGLLHLWRFLGPFPTLGEHEPDSRFEYIASLPESQRWCLHQTLHDIGCEYAINAKLDFIHPFRELRDYYRTLAHQAGIPWRSFTQCGAFAASVKHYLLRLRPHDLVELFCERYRGRSMNMIWGYPDSEEDSVWLPPETHRPHLLLRPTLEGDVVMLNPQHGDNELQSWNDFLEENRLWALGNLYKFHRPYTFEFVSPSAPTAGRGRIGFDRDDMRDARWVDGINYLGSNGLAELSGED